MICDVVEFEMVVCYTPHASMTFNLDAVIHTDGFVKDPACVGISVITNISTDSLEVVDGVGETPL